ncbi:MAG TPA: hypothetical protein VM287_01490 [Egibacteraceae bacterium]|nr:hypothetical protein [Egibacteraceae bacterium]
MRTARAHHDVRVDDVGRAAGGEKPAYVGGVNAVEVNDVRVGWRISRASRAWRSGQRMA